MKRFLSSLLLILLVISQAACSQPAGPAETPAPAQTEVQNTPAETPILSPSPTPEPEAYAPLDIFGSEFNPYGDMEFPDIFTVFAASFSTGSEKLQGKRPFVLSMTGSGNMFAAVAYHADVAGLSEDEKNDRINEYLNGGFCEFQGKNGTVITIREINPNDDRYEYVDGGCLIEITFYMDDTDIEKYISLVRDNYNLNALTSIAEYLDTEPDWIECDFGVNLHKKEASASVVYHVSDVDAIQQDIVENVESDWYDTQSGSIGLTYGMIGIKIQFDSKAGAIYVTQTASEFDTAVCEYVAPEVSLTKLGFLFDPNGVCGVYEVREPQYMSVAIHRPEWGEFGSDWNIEYMDNVNGYALRITYNADEAKYHVSVDKNNAGAAFDYLPATKEYGWEYPDKDTVKQMFNNAFGTQDEDFYEKSLAYFEHWVQERFGMSIAELYALPIK
jgi:predicted small lipoprotein YifL